MSRQFVTFQIGSELLGIDILLAHEVCYGMPLTPVDLAPPFVRGLMNLRGRIVTVLDLAVMLGLPPRPPGNHYPAIVLKTNADFARLRLSQDGRIATADDSIGLLVDGIGDVVVVERPEALQAPPAHESMVNHFFVDRVIDLGNQLLAILKVPDLLSFRD